MAHFERCHKNYDARAEGQSQHINEFLMTDVIKMLSLSTDISISCFTIPINLFVTFLLLPLILEKIKIIS